MKKIAFILVMTLAFPLLMPQASMMAANDGATASKNHQQLAAESSSYYAWTTYKIR